MIKRLAHFVALAVSTLTDDTKAAQRLQANEGAFPDGDRVIDNIPAAHHYGFTSVPPIGAALLLLRQYGDRSQSLAIGSHHAETRLKNLQPGDSALYDVRGAKMTFTEGGLLIDCAGLPAIVQNASTISLHATTKITLDAPNVECTGNFKADQLLTGDGDAIELGALRDAYNAHKHTGVTAGAGTTGTTDHVAP